MLLLLWQIIKTKKSYTATSDKYGYLKFTGLDAGEYTLQETDAPDGFTLNDAKHTVVITAEYNQDGTLKSYTIKIDDKVHQLILQLTIRE